MNKKEKAFFNLQSGPQKSKGPKMPLPMLQGIRKKIVKDYEIKQKQNLQENIQYSSSEKFHDLGFLKKKTQQKQTSNNKFMRNKYKYKDMRSKQLGNFKDGTLTISKNQIKKINAS